ncbi:hypothetical protein X975_06401, partial [Stegodyphus mimosarum]
MSKDFCKSWTKAYLSSPKTRKKWKDTQPNMKIGDIVLLLDDGHLPGSWPVGQVVELHHVTGGLVRVATIKPKNSLFKRNIHKLASLLIYQDQCLIGWEYVPTRSRTTQHNSDSPFGVIPKNS